MTHLAFIGPMEIIFVLLIIPLVLILPLLALISVLKNQFEGNDKIIWVLVILFLPVLGAILYFTMGRNKRIKQDSNYRT